MVSNDDLVEVPSDDDLKDKVDDEDQNAVKYHVGLSPHDTTDNAKDECENDAKNVTEFGPSDKYSCRLVVTLLEPLVPEPGVEESDE